MISFISRAVIASTLTVSVFLLMGYLIAPAEAPPEPGENTTQISITRKKRPEISPIREIEMPTPPKMDNAPPPMMLRARPVTNINNSGFANLQPTKMDNGTIGGTLLNNQRATPVVYFAPEYPQKPLMDNVEGWVLLEFTIAADGSVTDIEVVDANPAGTFERAAIRTIKRWSYQPKMVDGRLVAQRHMREIFRFEIIDK